MPTIWRVTAGVTGDLTPETTATRTGVKETHWSHMVSPRQNKRTIKEVYTSLAPWPSMQCPQIPEAGCYTQRLRHSKVLRVGSCFQSPLLESSKKLETGNGKGNWAKIPTAKESSG